MSGALLALVFAGCASRAGDWEQLRGPAAAELVIFERTIRYVTTYYTRSRWVPEPAAFCVAVGRRSARALSRQRRSPDETWIPSARLLARLADIEPPVAPASDCAWNSEVQEVHQPSGFPAVMIQVDQPKFLSPDIAEVRVATRENNAYQFVYQCDLRRSDSGWRVLRCV